ncbi:hypothetical protein OAT67_07990 [Bacteriovoracaceae bacterium]|nr:hypothetical protein [Bacteriovoracaceae bacterium]
MKHGFVLIFSFFILLRCWGGSRHVIKIDSDKSKTQSEVIVEFDNSTNLFTILHDKKKAESFHELKAHELIKLLKEKYVKEEFHEKVIKSVETVQLLDAMTDPSDERLMRASLLMLEDSLGVVDNPPGSDCNDF